MSDEAFTVELLLELRRLPNTTHSPKKCSHYEKLKLRKWKYGSKARSLLKVLQCAESLSLTARLYKLSSIGCDRSWFEIKQESVQARTTWRRSNVAFSVAHFELQFFLVFRAYSPHRVSPSSPSYFYKKKKKKKMKLSHETSASSSSYSASPWISQSFGYSHRSLAPNWELEVESASPQWSNLVLLFPLFW